MSEKHSSKHCQTSSLFFFKVTFNIHQYPFIKSLIYQLVTVTGSTSVTSGGVFPKCWLVVINTELRWTPVLPFQIVVPAYEHNGNGAQKGQAACVGLKSLWRHLSECFALGPLTNTDPVPKNRTRSLLAFSSAHLPLVKKIFSGPRNLENHRVIDVAHLAALLQKRTRTIIILQGHFCPFWIGQHQLKFGLEPMTQIWREISNK